MFACENDVVKQDFIRRNCLELQSLFTDIRDMGSDTSWCSLSQGPAAVPTCDVLVVSFSRKSASI